MPDAASAHRGRVKTPPTWDQLTPAQRERLAGHWSRWRLAQQLTRDCTAPDACICVEGAARAAREWIDAALLVIAENDAAAREAR